MHRNFKMGEKVVVMQDMSAKAEIICNEGMPDRFGVPGADEIRKY